MSIDSIEFAITLTRQRKKSHRKKKLQREIAFLVIYALVTRAECTHHTHSKIIPSNYTNTMKIMLIILSTLIHFSTERSSHRYFRIGHNQLNRFNRTFFGFYRKWLILCAPYTPYTSTYIVQLLCFTHIKRSFHKYTPTECDCTYWIYIEIISALFNQ